ncbi:peptidoglycan-binding protein [uncultured Tyzzerella sp.]|uniref:peptidoglycan-binding protein n=1 Tax=uncultured Tyzzerella sp. TaxID=2321398 RepID=UPI002941C499|nr:peptidoglycan-binding protein [uncultured Tyzzerella sp.]
MKNTNTIQTLENENINILQNEENNIGYLKFGVFDITVAKPLESAQIVISNGDKNITTIFTNESGQTSPIPLETPPLEYSLEPGSPMPYSTYNAVITADGYETEEVEGIQVYINNQSIQNIYMKPISLADKPKEVIVIPPPTIYGDYPEKIPEAEEKELPDESGFIVLDKVVIPEFIVVHDGDPNDNTAPNYWVPYKDYIKNVASSEIFSTWPDAAIRANILAINSFTLNRVYTEWYRSRGKNFTITNSTRFDQFFVPDRNIFEEISIVVDEMFTTYIKRPNQRQPLLTQYCDGNRVSCPNWLSQWGSKNLAENGYSALQILRYYYGNDIFLDNAEKVSGIPSSYPGFPLELGSSGEDVRTIQNQLNSISNNYPAINKLRADGIFGDQTKASVLTFQQIFNMPESGIVDFSTWYEISKVFVAVERIAEL